MPSLSHEGFIALVRETPAFVADLGIAKGEAMGIAKGEAMGIAKTIISMLEARGLTVTESQRQRVLDCTDVNQLNRWVARSVTITDVAALFE